MPCGKHRSGTCERLMSRAAVRLVPRHGEGESAGHRKGTDCCYAGVEVLPDGTFVTTTYGHWVEGEQPFVVSVRFPLRELDTRSGLPSAK